MYFRSGEQLQISDTLQPSRLGASSTQHIDDDDELAMMVMMMLMVMLMMRKMVMVAITMMINMIMVIGIFPSWSLLN